jgi:hypothetical protein
MIHLIESECKNQKSKGLRSIAEAFVLRVQLATRAIPQVRKDEGPTHVDPQPTSGVVEVN